jgi:hypothetical protein
MIFDLLHVKQKNRENDSLIMKEVTHKTLKKNK